MRDAGNTVREKCARISPAPSQSSPAISVYNLNFYLLQHHYLTSLQTETIQNVEMTLAQQS